MTRIQLSRPSITDEEIEASARVLRSRWLVYGPENRAFEEELAAACGRRFAVVVSSGTAALHLALLAYLDGKSGAGPRRLLVPAFTFPATANIARFVSTPPEVVLADVDAHTFCLPQQTATAWLAQQQGLLTAVHQFGFPSPLPSDIDAQTLYLSDAACAIGVPGAMRGRCVCLSFHPRKLLTTGEGGALLTDDEDLANQLRLLRAHGMTAVPGAEVMVMPASGLNYRLPEVAAAVGRVQLRRLPGLLAIHRERAAQYRERLSAVGLQLQADAPGRIWQTLALVLPDGVDRMALRARLLQADIETQIASYGLHKLQAFAAAPVFSPTGEQPASATALPVTERLHHQGMALPLHSELSQADVERVCSTLITALGR